MNATAETASRVQLPPGEWRTVLDCLCDHFPAIARDAWRDRMERGRVQDDTSRPLAIDHPYRVGMDIRYFREVRDEVAIPFTEAVLHHDAHLLVVDKPHFLPVVPAGRHVSHTLLARLRRRFDIDALVPLHRIDRDTAGLVLFSTNADSRAAYQALFRNRRITKTYHAWAPPLPHLRFPLIHRARLERGDPFFRMQAVDGEPNSETTIDVLARSDDAWLYALAPVTGRKHQLRMHMAMLGAAITNDVVYPVLQPARAADDFSRPLQLLAQALAFDDPLSGARRAFVSARTLSG